MDLFSKNVGIRTKVLELQWGHAERIAAAATIAFSMAIVLNVS
jgi:hypothetical protein